MEKNVIDGLKLIQKGISVLLGDTTEVATPIKEKPKKAEPKVEVEETKVDETPNVSGDYSVEELNNMKFNDLKKLGASLGVKCSGTRAQIVERILNASSVSEEVEEVEEEVEQPKPTKKAPTRKAPKKAPKIEVSDEALQTAKEVAEEMDDKDIIEYLEDLEVEVPSRKHDDVLLALAKAIDDGLVEFEDEEEEVVEEKPTKATKKSAKKEVVEEDDEEEEELEITPTTYVEEFDVDGVNNPSDMTKKRAKACEKKCAKVIDDITTGKLSAEDVTEFVQTFTNDEQKELLGDEPTDDELILMYLELTRAMIDDDGTFNEPQSPYVIGEDNFCCGHPLNYIEDTNKFVCEICGTEYEAE